ncbi:MAG: thiamine pyrophosphate-binding protein [Polyangiaceae bacterium]|nr:thiamine pyrophosphate-binding protein [Polyangiaceae bacterium]
MVVKASHTKATTCYEGAMHGGDIIGEILVRRGIKHLFTLCGGHISPILVGAKRRGIHVVDMRGEANAVFAADSAARLTGNVGVAAVTAGPGVTNTITAIKNAQMAESPVLLFGGATATVLRGRGSLQDIDQLSILAPITKWATRVTTYKSLGPTVEQAMDTARSGVPGPVFVEIPIDLLYPEETVRKWTLSEATMKGPLGDALRLYLKGHLYRQFSQPHLPIPTPRMPALVDLTVLGDPQNKVAKVAEMLAQAQRPLLVLGSQTLVNEPNPERIANAVRRLGVPVYLGGMARGLLGKRCEIQFRHERGKALKEADLVIVCGFPFDFRLKYGQSIPRSARLVAANLSAATLRKNRIPDIAVCMHPGQFLVDLAERAGTSGAGRKPWLDTLTQREQARDAEITREQEPTPGRVNPLRFFLELDKKLDDSAMLVADGGDFVATGSYILRPRSPLSWLDPGVYGTLGVGGGFATGAAVCRPGSEVWILWGDGSSAYSLAEFDTFVRHGLAPIAVIGTDALWAQIARDQTDLLGDDVGTVLRDTSYEKVAEGYGGVGLLLNDESKIAGTLDEAKRIARSGKPVCINVLLARSDFRKGSISV